MVCLLTEVFLIKSPEWKNELDINFWNNALQLYFSQVWPHQYIACQFEAGDTLQFFWAMQTGNSPSNQQSKRDPEAEVFPDDALWFK